MVLMGLHFWKAIVGSALSGVVCKEVLHRVLKLVSEDERSAV